MTSTVAHNAAPSARPRLGSRCHPSSNGGPDPRRVAAMLRRAPARCRSRRTVGRATTGPTSPRPAPVPANATDRSRTSGDRSTATTVAKERQSARTPRRRSHHRRRSTPCRARAAAQRSRGTRSTRRRSTPRSLRRRHQPSAATARAVGDTSVHAVPATASRPADRQLPHPRRQEIERAGRDGCVSSTRRRRTTATATDDHHRRDQSPVSAGSAAQTQATPAARTDRTAPRPPATRSAAAATASGPPAMRSSRRAGRRTRS